jgi:hypothetical protein
MLGTIIGDIVGSRFEFNNHKNKDFELFSKGCSVTDDSIKALAYLAHESRDIYREWEIAVGYQN